MGAFSSFVETLAAIAKTALYVQNLGAPQLIKQLDSLQSNLEQYKQAVLVDDTSKMRQLLEECDAESMLLEKRLFKALDEEVHNSLHMAVNRARTAKRSMLRSAAQRKAAAARRKAEATRRKAAITGAASVQKSLNAKRAKLAGTINASNEKQRQKLLLELDAAIGRLSGISKSLSNSAG
jgi:hypothetical protein